MATNDATIVKIKHEILEEVAKLVFAGKFEEEKDELPLRLMPGPTAKYRCCVYKEREIVRQRVRLAEGRNVEGAPNNLVVQVVRAACEECPISRYVVTDNCQKWEKPVSSLVDSVRLILDGHGHILTHRSVKNAENVQKPVHTMRLQT